MSAISKNVFKAIGQPHLHKPTKVPCGLGRQVRLLYSQAFLQTAWSINQKVYVIKNLTAIYWASNLSHLEGYLAIRKPGYGPVGIIYTGII